MDFNAILEQDAVLASVLVFAVGLLFGVVIASRSARLLRWAHNLLRFLSTPLRRIGLFGKATRRIKSARNAAVTSSASISVLDRKTEIEKAIFLQRHGLFKPGENVEPEEATLKKLEKSGKEIERRYIIRSRGFFKRIHIPPTYQPPWMVAGLTADTVEEFRESADGFFNGQVDLSANDQALYEDVDGAHSIYLFGKPNADLSAYNAINEARKNINANALKLIMSFLIVILVCLGVILFRTQQTVWSAAPIIMGGGLMVLLQYAYKTQQEHSIRSLGKFMNLYVGYLSDRFRDVTGEARGVTVGNEKDSATLAENAKVWTKLMVWIAFRTFFIETFLRNQLYQISRNSGYYAFFAFALIFFVVVLLIPSGHIFGYYDLSVYLESDTGRYVAIGAALLIFFYINRIFAPVITTELDDQDWRGFDKLLLGEKMDEVVGKYAEEIGYWKQRFDR
ncbi:MAG: hypothetical protein AAFW81_00740 [Pseudomonadota bacterium]